MLSTASWTHALGQERLESLQSNTFATSSSQLCGLPFTSNFYVIVVSAKNSASYLPAPSRDTLPGIRTLQIVWPPVLDSLLLATKAGG